MDFCRKCGRTLEDNNNDKLCVSCVRRKELIGVIGGVVARLVGLAVSVMVMMIGVTVLVKWVKFSWNV
ncbi:MAG: hypothetical protein EBR81_14660 [Proteobacteria bacterium]|nr:hypothetical protein [Pseudomonadota bacterium]